MSSHAHMDFDFDSLEPFIEQILTAPGTDLTTISAKRVRKQLQLIDPSLSPEFLKEHRDAVDIVIARVFEKVQGSSGSQDSEEEEPLAPGSRRRRETPDEGYSVPKEEDTDVEGTPPPAKKAKKAAKRELSDAELARQLSSEINSRTRRSNGKPKAPVANGTPKKRKTKAKSAAMVDTDDDSDSNEGKRPSKKSSDGGSARGGLCKTVSAQVFVSFLHVSQPILNFLGSEPLATVLGTDSLSRPQVVKQLWAYIKANGLQNPDNKREIICDTALRPVFNVDKIDMFKMNKVLGQHLHELE
ncbi:Upstream activation factor subunit spp27 [Mycena sanguinolenta]|uniref:Upstream activation factor subunit spp27 n=1 Tax=Mycena sanguinolenta TaxID=230812 RepID=A0A8H6Y3R8_9AGAR|nr:Upstream activation factor subunit spp27 [Mycena sanguinolenta]